MTILFVISCALFWAGVVADARSSKGGIEKTKLYRDKAGIFSLKRYLITMVGFFAVTAGPGIYGLVSDEKLLIGGVCLTLIGGAVLRFRAAARNRRVSL